MMDKGVQTVLPLLADDVATAGPERVPALVRRNADTPVPKLSLLLLSCMAHCKYTNNAVLVGNC
jgi:hypothetical protein